MDTLNINSCKLVYSDISLDWKLILDKYSTLDKDALLLSVYGDYFEKNNISDFVEICALMLDEEFIDERYEDFYEMISRLYSKLKDGIREEFEIKVVSSYLSKCSILKTSNLDIDLDMKKYKVLESNSLNQEQEEAVVKMLPYIEKMDNLVNLIAGDIIDVKFSYIEKLIASNALDCHRPFYYKEIDGIIRSLSKMNHFKRKTNHLIKLDSFGSPRVMDELQDCLVLIKDDMEDYNYFLKVLIDTLESEIKNYLKVMFHYKKAHLESLKNGKLDKELVDVYSAMSKHETEIRGFMDEVEGIKELSKEILKLSSNPNNFYNEKNRENHMRFINFLNELGYSDDLDV